MIKTQQAKIAVIGGGNLGKALVTGLLKSKKFDANNINISKRNPETLNQFKKLGVGIGSDNIAAINNADVVIIAVLPQQFDVVMNEIGTQLDNKLVISTVSGVSIADIRSKIERKIAIVRAMPNTAIAIGESMTCYATNKEGEQERETIELIFNSVGTSLEINEEHMTSATALCACGVAFFLRAVRAASQGGIEIGFHADEALKMAAQTAKGAAALLLHSEKHPEREIDKVTSPEGCTIAGLNHMEHAGFSSAMIKGITISANKAAGLYVSSS